MVVTASAIIHLVFGVGLMILALKNRDDLIEECYQRASGNSTSSDSTPSSIVLNLFDSYDNLDEEDCQAGVNWYLGSYITITLVTILLTVCEF